MQKNFDAWNTQKKAVDARGRAPFYHEREVWWCALGVNVGSEQDGSGSEYRRPIVVLKSLGGATFVGVPLTTSTRAHSLRPPVGVVDGKEAHALLSQIRALDAKRLVRKIGYLEKDTYSRIRKAAKDML